MGDDFLLSNSVNKICWISGFPSLYRPMRKPVCYIPNAFRIGTADILGVYGSVALDFSSVSCTRNTSRIDAVVAAALPLLLL